MNDTMSRLVRLELRTQDLEMDGSGYAVWRTHASHAEWPAHQTALLLCDVWDKHWCRGAVERLEAMVPRMNRVVQSARDQGILIIHAPSETLEYYRATAARQRIADASHMTLAPLREHADPPLPIDDSDGGSDTGELPWHRAWTRQHAGIDIDHARDVISDDGDEICRYLLSKSIGHLLIMGVHTNMCVLNRSFGIKRMVRQGLVVALVRDLTDTMYNPARAPYVSHGKGTALVIGYIEKFWCPTVASQDLLPVSRAQSGAGPGHRP